MTIQQVGQLIGAVVLAYFTISLISSKELLAAIKSKLALLKFPFGTGGTSQADIDDLSSHDCVHKLIDVATALRKAKAYELAEEVDALLGEVTEALSMAKINQAEAAASDAENSRTGISQKIYDRENRQTTSRSPIR